MALVLRALYDHESAMRMRDFQRLFPGGQPHHTVYALERRGLVLRVRGGMLWTLMAVGEDIVKEQIRLQGPGWGRP